MMRGMFRRKLKDFAEQQQNNDVDLLERLKFKRIDEDQEEERAKTEFRKKLMQVRTYNDDNLLNGKPNIKPVGRPEDNNKN